MAEFTHIDLRKLREARKMPRWQLASLVGVSEDTLGRWETGEAQPHPDDVGRIEHALDAEHEMVWHRWMLSNCESYRERHQEAKPAGLLGAIVAARHELSDVLNIQDAVERDAVDGAIDDPALRAAYRRELEEANAAITAALAQIPKD